MLTVMMRGLTFHLDLPLAHFATVGMHVHKLVVIYQGGDMF